MPLSWHVTREQQRTVSRDAQCVQTRDLEGHVSPDQRDMVEATIAVITECNHLLVKATALIGTCSYGYEKQDYQVHRFADSSN